jgi:hypothetical protein
MDREFNIKRNTKRREKQYWIDRLGKIYKYNGDLGEEITSMHSEIASVLYPESNCPTDILSDLGWVTVGSVAYMSPVIHKKPSQAQINILIELGLYEYLKIIK